MYRVAKIVGQGLDVFGAKGYVLLYPNGKKKTLSKDLVRLSVRVGSLTILNPNKDIERVMKKYNIN